MSCATCKERDNGFPPLGGVVYLIRLPTLADLHFAAEKLSPIPITMRFPFP